MNQQMDFHHPIKFHLNLNHNRSEPLFIFIRIKYIIIEHIYINKNIGEYCFMKRQTKIFYTKEKSLYCFLKFKTIPSFFPIME